MTHPLIDRLTRAATFYRAQLRASPRAIGYLKKRGLGGDIAGRYGLGYAPGGFQALREVFPDYDDRSLEKAGLVTFNDSGIRYDRFRDRIMFPILDDAGGVIGFGGRVLEGDGPKYLNSPESEVFQKRGVLFGLPQATHAIDATRTVFIVEGYLDVVSLVQHGVQNAVATLGTATTGQHVAQLLALGSRLVFCFDGDDAGRRAAARAMEVCLPHVTDTTDIEFLFLPRDHDPDSYVRAKGGEAFNDLALEASPFEGFFLANAMQGCQLEYAEGRARLVAAAALTLQQIEAPAMLRRILTTIALHTGFTVEELIDLCGLRVSPMTTGSTCLS